ncbi:MAG: ECF transporter S component [Acholeplasmatales bacterium]|nr:ECF transporter S component [Acholeplasmatales bacterium]
MATMSKQKLALFKIILTALFTALCFIGVYIHIPMPTGFVHLGNMICILGALLIGGVYGGISGSLGMGLADLALGYGLPSFLRTIILKFIMGLIAGLLFKLILKKKLNVKKLTIILVVILGLLTITTITLSIVSYNNGFVITYIKSGKEVVKTIKIHWIIPLFTGIMFIIGIIDLIIEKKLGVLSGAALIASSMGIFFNIFGEVYIKAVLYYWVSSAYSSLNDAYLYAVTGLPSTIITSVLTVSIIGFIYYPIYRATKSFNPLDYVTPLIEDTSNDDFDFDDEEKDAED